MSDPSPPHFASDSPATVSLNCILQIAESAGLADLDAFGAKITVSAYETADPETAVNRLEQFLASTSDPKPILRELETQPDARLVLLTLLANSRFFTDVLMRQPEMFLWLLHEGDLHMSRLLSHYRREVRRTMAAHPDSTELRRVLSRMRRREMVRIGLRDILNLGTVEETTREISELAQALTAAAAETAYAEMTARYGEPMTEPSPSNPARPCGMCVLGMGKLGGRELNFSSDIDLILFTTRRARPPVCCPMAAARHHNPTTFFSHAWARRSSNFSPDATPRRNSIAWTCACAPRARAAPSRALSIPS